MKIIIKKINQKNITKKQLKNLEQDILIKNLKKIYSIKNIEIAHTKNGKPFLKNVKNIHFSISHTEDLLVIAIDDKNIGIDVEKIRNYDKKINNILKINPKNEEEFFKEWTKKEAAIKLKGLALKDINSIDYTGINFKIKKYQDFIITIAYEI